MSSHSDLGHFLPAGGVDHDHRVCGFTRDVQFGPVGMEGQTQRVHVTHRADRRIAIERMRDLLDGLVVIKRFPVSLFVAGEARVAADRFQSRLASRHFITHHRLHGELASCTVTGFATNAFIERIRIEMSAGWIVIDRRMALEAGGIGERVALGTGLCREFARSRRSQAGIGIGVRAHPPVAVLVTHGRRFVTLTALVRTHVSGGLGVGGGGKGGLIRDLPILGRRVFQEFPGLVDVVLLGREHGGM